MQAQALYGDKIKDLECTHSGRGGNGKSILMKNLFEVFVFFIKKIPTAIITSQNKGARKKPDPFMSGIQGCRYAVANKPKYGIELYHSIVKVFGSQDPVNYRGLYSNNPVVLKN